MGIAAEIDMLVRAMSRGLVAFSFALSAEDAYLFACSDVDGIILNVGWTREIADTTEKAANVQMSIWTILEIVKAVRRSGRDPLRLFFDVTVTEPQDFQEMLRTLDLHGYAGG